MVNATAEESALVTRRRGDGKDVEGRVVRICKKCAWDCRSCDTSGAGRCDVCLSRHVLTDEGLCEPCAEDCLSCYTDGPGLCDDGQCFRGYARSEHRECVPCPKGCMECTGEAPELCTKCEVSYKKSPEGCVFDWEHLRGVEKVFGAFAIVIVTPLVLMYFGVGSTRAPPTDATK